jgi:hypothetical protein
MSVVAIVMVSVLGNVDAEEWEERYPVVGGALEKTTHRLQSGGLVQDQWAVQIPKAWHQRRRCMRVS